MQIKKKVKKWLYYNMYNQIYKSELSELVLLRQIIHN